MKVIILFVLFACSAVLAQSSTPDDCLTYSYCTGAVNSLVNLSPSLFTGITEPEDINTALNAIYGVVVGITSPFVVNVYVGTTNSDFYMIKNCPAQEGPNNYCSYNGQYQYIAYVRNTAYFGDTVRHVFAVYDGVVDILDDDTAFTPESSTYDPTQRFWFNATAGYASWSTLQSFGSGGQGKTYAMAFGNVLVAAADRFMDEYCGPCMSNSYGIPVTQALAVSNLAPYIGVTNQASFSGISTLIFNILNAVASPYTAAAEVGFANLDSYLVKFCTTQSIADNTPECSGQKYLFYTTNVAIFGDLGRRVFALNATGGVGSPVTTQSAYNITQRPWYQVVNGWTDAYGSVSSGNFAIRSYSKSFNGGVVSTDHILQETCSRAVPASTNSNGPSIGVYILVGIAAGLVVALIFFFIRMWYARKASSAYTLYDENSDRNKSLLRS